LHNNWTLHVLKIVTLVNYDYNLPNQLFKPGLNSVKIQPAVIGLTINTQLRFFPHLELKSGAFQRGIENNEPVT
jgi:hypothetical protein